LIESGAESIIKESNNRKNKTRHFPYLLLLQPSLNFDEYDHRVLPRGVVVVVDLERKNKMMQRVKTK